MRFSSLPRLHGLINIVVKGDLWLSFQILNKSFWINCTKSRLRGGWSSNTSLVHSFDLRLISFSFIQWYPMVSTKEIDSVRYLVILACSHLQQHSISFNQHMCTFINDRSAPIPRFVDFGLTRGASSVFGPFWLSREHLFPPWASHSPLYSHPRMPWTL